MSESSVSLLLLLRGEGTILIFDFRLTNSNTKLGVENMESESLIHLAFYPIFGIYIFEGMYGIIGWKKAVNPAQAKHHLSEAT